MKDVITKAVEEERENLEKVHAEEREMWKTEHARDQERVAEAIQAAVQEQQRMSQVSMSLEAWCFPALAGEGTCCDVGHGSLLYSGVSSHQCFYSDLFSYILR